MAVVTLRAPLRDLAGGSSRLDVPGATVAEVIGRLEQDHPSLAGWVLDERGRIREHVKVFVNGDVAGLEHPVAAADLVHVLPAISGGRG
jgi:molybdopterin synthase sulfur carrier subunit